MKGKAWHLDITKILLKTYEGSNQIAVRGAQDLIAKHNKTHSNNQLKKEYFKIKKVLSF